MTLETLLENKEYLIEQLDGFISDDFRSSIKKRLDDCGYNIPLVVEAGVNEIREVMRTKEGQMAFQKATSYQEDPSIGLEQKLNCLELIFDDKLAAFVILLMLHIVDDTICIEDYVDIEDAE